MVLNRYRKGYEKERRIVNNLKKEGWLAFRSAGSHSPIDVFALNPLTFEIKLIQSKSDKASESYKKRIFKEISKYEGDYVVKCEVI